MFFPRFGPTSPPENTLADAKTALANARSKFDAAVTHAGGEATKRSDEIDALTEVISDKTARRSELFDLANVAAKVRDAIAGLV